MKKQIIIIAILLLIVVAYSCKKNKTDDNNQTNPPTNNDNYTSTANFFAVNATPMQTYTFDASIGGVFTTANGTIITVPANAFKTQAGGAVVGNVTLQFKDVYKKSDMLLNNISTSLMWSDKPLKSAGMFNIKALQGTDELKIASGRKIMIKQPLNGMPVDNNMNPFIFQINCDTINGWVAPPNDSLHYPIDSVYVSATGYVFSMFSFSHVGTEGTWGNTDNETFFAAYPTTTLVLHSLDSVNTNSTEMFLVFSTVSSMVHVYRYMSDFPDPWAPLGFQCTAVAIGVKGGKLYSSFTPITITANLTVNFSLSETTTADFKAQLEALN